MQKHLLLIMGLVLLSSSFLLAVAFKPGASDDQPAINSGVWQEMETEGQSLMRLAVPEGWLVKAEGEQPVTFVYDPDFSWRGKTSGTWQKHDLEGGAVHRLKLPLGWLVTSGSQNGITHFTFIHDRLHGWSPRT
jgi:hypothetical protein